MSKPSVVPRWADVAGTLATPSSAKQDVGWLSGERPASQYMNWLLRWLCEWAKWLNTGDVSFNSMTLATTLALTGDISPASINTNQNDYNPTGLSGASRIRQAIGASVDITGLVGGADGRVLILQALGTSSQSIRLKHESGSSSAANRFNLPGATDLIINGAGASVILVYDATLSRWTAIRTNAASQVEQAIDASAYVGDTGAGAGAYNSASHYVSSFAGAGLVTAPVVVPVGKRITSFTQFYSVNGTGASITPALKRINLTTGAVASVWTGSPDNTGAAGVVESQTGSGLSHVVLSGEAYFAEVTIANGVHRVYGAIVTWDDL